MNMKNTFKLILVAAAAYAVGKFKGHVECLDKIHDKYGSIIPDDFIKVPIYGKCSLGVLNSTVEEVEVSEDNVD